MHHTIGGPTSALVIAQQQAGAVGRKQAASYLSISTRKLDQLAANGELLRIKIGSKTLFRVVDLDAFLESKLQGAKK